MNAVIKDGVLVISIPLEKKPRPSTSGKSLLVAGTGGFRTSDAEVDGQKVSISVNATIRAS